MFEISFIKNQNLTKTKKQAFYFCLLLVYMYTRLTCSRNKHSNF